MVSHQVSFLKWNWCLVTQIPKARVPFSILAHKIDGPLVYQLNCSIPADL